MALKLSDCELGNAPSRSGKAGFTLRGKDSGKSLGRTHEYAFRTDSMDQAALWWSKMEKYVGSAGGTDGAEGTDEEVESPVSVTSARSKDAIPTSAGPSATAGATAAPTGGGAGHAHGAGATTTAAPAPTTAAAPAQSAAQAAATKAAS
jgi:hypothetical protein